MGAFRYTFEYMQESSYIQRKTNKRALVNKARKKARHFQKREAIPLSHTESEEIQEGERLGIVAGRNGHTFSVLEHDILYECQVSPKSPANLLHHLVVGDAVIFEEDERGILHILRRRKRRSWIVRMRGDRARGVNALEEHTIAANVDSAVIVAAADSPPFHPRFIDRYLAVLQNGNVEPVICLNKIDLTTERHPILSFYRKLNIPIIETSVVTGEGLPQLGEMLDGKTAVFLGQSGVGKSSISNAILPDASIAVADVSKKGSKGRHTTTTSNLYRWQKDSYIIDTPGIRSLGIENIDKDRIRFFFSEFAGFEDQCNYTDCLHDHEPDCAVKTSAESGEINMYRYESYLRMLHE